MNSALIVSVLSAVTACLFMYLDTKIFDSPKTKFTYFKNMILVAGISYAIVYFMGSPSLPQVGGNALAGAALTASAIAPGPETTTSLITDIGQEMMTGMPNF